MLHFFFMLGVALVIVEALMFLFWLLYIFSNNVSIIDIGWGLGFIGTILTYFILGEGFVWRKILVLIIVSVWALRLVCHLAQRFLPDQDDPRYQLLLSKWPLASQPHLQVLSLFCFQGLLLTILSIPFALMTQNIYPFFSTFEVYGLLIWMGGVIGEAIADHQLNEFKMNRVDSGEVCAIGLWKYSRHPNYFFEWIVWIGFSIMAFSAPYGWLGLISPLLMLYLLLKATGIPLTEAHLEQTKGEAYRDYQAGTSPFFPWFSFTKKSVG
jgi:steroid 5-alpha reductase family enzyme